MRMRKKRHGSERMAALAALFIEKEEEIADLAAVFGATGHALRLEIGCGKGGFIRQLSKKEPDFDYLALEKIPDVATVAAERYATDRGLGDLDSQGAWKTPDGRTYAHGAAVDIPQAARGNVRFLVGDAALLAERLPEASFESIYLNFSDPWEKKGYASRRLTHPDFLKRYLRLLIPGGRLCFKTDNVKLFEYSEETIPAAGFEIEFRTDDLHHSERAGDNVMTEYETNFSERGIPIHSIIARKKEN